MHYEDPLYDALGDAMSDEDAEALHFAITGDGDAPESVTDLYVSEQYNSSVIQSYYSGYFTFNGKEYAFEYENGINNGSRFNSVEEGGDAPTVTPEPVKYTIAPKKIPTDPQKAKILLMKWDIMRDNKRVKEQIRNYMYDRYFSPTNEIEKHYKKIFDDYGVDVVDEETANDIRNELEQVSSLAGTSST